MAVDRELVEQQLKALGDFHRFFTSKEIRYLPRVLAPGETIHGVTSGFYEARTWIIVVTDARLIFLDKGMFYGLKQVDLPLSQISSISHKTGFFFGEISVTTSGGIRKIENVSKRDALKVASVISSLVHGEKPRAAQDSPGKGDSLASQMERLSVLRDKGALTDEEFTASKAKLLNAGDALRS
jgi:hypothetical protein